MKVAYIFPPPWDPTYPPHTMVLFEGSTKYHHHEFLGFDLNVDLYHAVSEEDKELWKEQYAVRWRHGSDKIVQRYSGFLDAYITDILNMNINLYAIYASIYSKYMAFFIAKRIKENDPESAIILGGPDCFPAYEGLRILENEFVDAICTGEGDLVWPAILDHFSKKGNLRIDVPGIAYKAGDGTIVDGGIPELVDDLNSLPFPDYSSIDFTKYGGDYHISTMGSRGCINTCAFCSERPNFFKYRHRTAENIVEEIEKHIEVLQKFAANSTHGANERPVSRVHKLFSRGKKIYSILRNSGATAVFQLQWPENTATAKPNTVLKARCESEVIPYVAFNDSLINGKPRELHKFCDMVIGKDLQFRWGGMALLRKEMTRDLLTKMKKAGCVNLSWGMESGCQDVLTLMHKRFFTMDLAKSIIEETYKVGISQSISLIVGFPGETEEMFQETIRFVKAYKKYLAVIGAQPMMVAHNSLVYDKYEDFGLDFHNSRVGLEWSSSDGTNTYEIRLKRLEVLKAILRDQILQIDKSGWDK